jgi:hypothetical protein
MAELETTERVTDYLAEKNNDLVAAQRLLGLPLDEVICLAVKELFRKRAIDGKQGELFGEVRAGRKAS